jgi:hypothetical protein
VTDVEFYVSRDWTERRAGVRPRSGRGASGLGVEVLVGIAAGTRESAGGAGADSAGGEGAAGAAAARDSAAAREAPARDTTVVFELAFGYGQSGGYASRAPGVDLYAALREVPAVTVYATFMDPPRTLRTALFNGVPYAGVRTGYVTVQNGRAYTPDAVYELAGDTFELAGVAGVSWGLMRGANVFVEGAYAWRSFPSVAWTIPGGTGPLPAGFPKSLDFSGPSVAMGFQVVIKE